VGVIDQKIKAVHAMIEVKDSVAAARSLERALKAAELLNLELDELLVATEPEISSLSKARMKGRIERFGLSLLRASKGV
jgi:hypothetical protein